MRDPTVTPGREAALEQRNQELKNQIQESEARLASIIRFYKERERVHLEEIYEHREFWARLQRAQEQPEEQPPQAGSQSPQG